VLDELEAMSAVVTQRVAEAHASHRRDLVPVRQAAVVAWQVQRPDAGGSPQPQLPDSAAARAE
jgi:hypothetical protein